MEMHIHAHTHTHTHIERVRDNGGGLAERVGTRCEQLGVLPREKGEGVCPLEAGHDQADSVVPREVEGVRAADGCTQSLGGIETPGALVVARIPRVCVPVCVVASVVPVSVVPVCVVSRCVYTSVWKCVLRRTHTGSKRACVRATPSETPCADETLSEPPCATVPPCMRETLCVPTCVSKTPGMSEAPCASGVVASVPACVLPGTPCVKGAPQGEETTCAREAARVCEPPCVEETPRVSAPAGVSSVVCMSEARGVRERPRVRTACVRSLYAREMSVGMREHVAASPGVSVRVVVCRMSLVTRGSLSARVEWRRRLRLWRDQCRVAAVVAIGTGPGMHGSVRVVRAVPRTRPPRARLRG